MNPKTSLYFSTLMTSIIIVISSSSWFVMWLGLEINTLAFCALLFSSYNSKASESTMKYFLIQSMASAIFIISVLMLHSQYFLKFVSPTLIIISMMVKLGLFPFHIWFTTLMPTLSWLNCFYLMTLQKISPLWVISISSYSTLIIFMTIVSALASSVLIFNVLSTKMLLAFSSISHLSWILLILPFNPSLSWIYLTIYSITSSALMYSFYLTNTQNLSQTSLYGTTMLEKFILFFLLLSMGGMPPMLGFLPKWLIIDFMIHSPMILLPFILSSLLNLFVYCRISYTQLLKNPCLPSPIMTHQPSHHPVLSFFSCLGLPLALMFM